MTLVLFPTSCSGQFFFFGFIIWRVLSLSCRRTDADRGAEHLLHKQVGSSKVKEMFDHNLDQMDAAFKKKKGTTVEKLIEALPCMSMSALTPRCGQRVLIEFAFSIVYCSYEHCLQMPATLA